MGDVVEPRNGLWASVYPEGDVTDRTLALCATLGIGDWY